jgi:HK97 gp10 family phage protein
MSEYLDNTAFLAALPGAFAELVVDAKLINRDRAQKIAANARRYVHVGDPATDPHSGQTRDAIEVTVTSAGDVEVGTNPEKVRNEEALAEEFGTSKMSPRSFMRPAIQEETG